MRARVTTRREELKKLRRRGVTKHMDIEIIQNMAGEMRVSQELKPSRNERDLYITAVCLVAGGI